MWLWRTEGQRQQLFFAMSVWILPVFTLSLAGLNWQVFHGRYVLASSMGLALLFARLWDRFRHGRRLLALILSLFIFGAFSYSLLHYFGAYRKAADWGALVQWQSELLTPADIVIQASHDPAFSWHLQKTASGAREMVLPIHPQQPAEEIEETLAELADHPATLWSVGREFQDWPNQGVVLNWLAAKRQLWFQGERDGIPYAAFLPYEPSVHEMNLLAIHGAMFGTPGIVELRGYLLDKTPDALSLRLYWLPIQRSKAPLKAFIHLVKLGERQPRAQADKPPVLATDSWTTGELLREIYTLRTEKLPAGDYSIQVGWYDPVTGIRLPVNGQDFTTLTSVSLP